MRVDSEEDEDEGATLLLVAARRALQTSLSAASFRRWCKARPPASKMMAPARESGTASAAVGGALWAPATSGLLTPPPLPLLLPGAVKLGFELFGDVPPPGSAGVADADAAAAAGGAGATGSG